MGLGLSRAIVFLKEKELEVACGRGGVGHGEGG